MLQLLNLDVLLTGFLANLFPHTAFFNYFFLFFSLQQRYLIWIAIILFLLLFEEKKDPRFLVYFLVSVLITAFMVNIVFKNAVRRHRPQSTLIESVKNCPTDYSFPSGHASTAFATATSLALFDKKRHWFYYFIAGLIAYSRLYLYCHFLSDVVVGGLIGYAIARILFSIFKPLLHPSTTSK